MQGPDSAQGERRTGRVLRGGAVALGWVAYDLATCLTSGRPTLALEIAPGSLAAVLAGLVFGWLARLRGFVALALVASTVAAVFPSASAIEFTLRQSWLPRAVFLLTLAFALSGLLGRWKPSAPRWGLVLGVFFAAGMAEYRSANIDREWSVLLAALIALPVGTWADERRRRAADVLLVLLPFSWLLWSERDDLRPSRPDLAPPAVAAPEEAPNLVLIVLDTVRADRLAPYGYERVTTPLLDEWVREHFTLYTNARSTSSWTLPSHASLFTGLLPAEHGATHPGRQAQMIHPELPTLAERLRKVGYQTAAICSNNVYLRPRFGLDRGYEHFDDRLSGVLHRYLPLAQLLGFHLRAGHLPYRDGRIITRLAVDWLDQSRREDAPFFLTLNYMDAHAPNMPPPPHDRMFGEEQKFDPLDRGFEHQGLLYDRELHHLDTHLDRLLRALRERRLLDHTAVVITSDHGESIGDHGFHLHGWNLYDELVKVPLYVKPPGRRTETTDATELNGADVFHLALDLVGHPGDGTVTGQSPVDCEWYVYLPGVKEWEEQYSHRDLTVDFVSWMDGSRKTIVSSKLVVEVYDLAVDPDELAPLELGEAELEAAQRRALDWWAAHPIEGEAAEGELDEDTLRRMRALGYLGDEE